MVDLPPAAVTFRMAEEDPDALDCEDLDENGYPIYR
jgi:hypothetical protein